MLVVEPVPLSIRARLDAPDPDSLIGQLPIFRPGGYRILPPVWGFGALPSAGRFADALAGLSDFLKADHGL